MNSEIKYSISLTLSTALSCFRPVFEDANFLQSSSKEWVDV